MTTPAAPQEGWEDAIDKFSKLAAGNQNLITHPAAVQQLAAAGATPQQAQVINQFMTGLQLRNQVQSARQAGTRLALTDTDRSMLDTIGQHYSDVDWTANDQADLDTRIKQGQANDANLELAALKTQLGGDKKDDGGWFGGGVGGFTHHLISNPVTDEVFVKLPKQVAAFGNISKVLYEQAFDDYSAADKAAAKDQGYNLDNPWDAFAYEASGKRPMDPDALYKGHDPAEVAAAFAFINDPHSVTQSVLNDPDETSRNAKLAALSSKGFQDLVARVRHDMPTPGNLVTAGIDPVEHPTLVHVLGTTTDVAYMFLTDPTIVAFNARAAYKLTKVGLETIGDTSKVRSIVDGSAKGLDAGRVHNSIGQLINSTKLMRVAYAAGDNATIAAETARMRSLGLDHMIPDFAGHRAVGLDATTAEKKFLFQDGAPIEDFDQAATYLSSRIGLLRFVSGQTAMEGRLLPGALSAYGYRALKANRAANLARSSLAYAEKSVAAKKIDAARVLATGDDAVDATTGTILADAAHATQGGVEGALSSRVRGEARRLQLVGKGALQTPSGSTQVGLSPLSIAARIFQTFQRVGSYVPNKLVWSIDDPDGGKRLFQYANMFLTRGDANLLHGLYALGDEGTRKAVLQSVHLQTLHAAGMGATEGGRDVIAGAERAFTDQRYTSVPGADRIIDSVTGEEQSWAVHLSQANAEMTLTDFRTLQQLGAKIGFWQASLGRAFNSQIMTSAMGVVRVGWQLTIRNLTRNGGETAAMAAVRGELGDMLRTKAVLATTGNARRRTVMSRWVENFAPVARVGMLYRHALLRNPGDNVGMNHLLEYMEESPDRVAAMQQTWTGLNRTGLTDMNGIGDATAIIRDGLVPVQMKLKYMGFADHSISEDMAGADRMSSALGIAHGGDADYFDAITSHLQHPDKFDIETLPYLMQADAGRLQRLKLMRFANEFVDPVTGKGRTAITDAEKSLAVTQLAHRQVQDWRHLLTNRSGKLNDELIEHMRTTGQPPSAQWIMDNLAKAEDRPLSVSAPRYEAIPTTGVSMESMAGALASWSGNVYERLIGGPIARMTSDPIYFANYGKQRAFIEPLKADLIAQGLTEQTAKLYLRDLAEQRAFEQTIRYVDHPALRTQMDILGRNFFAYSRATRAFAQRWIENTLENPARLRKVFLALEGAHHVGLTYTDANGNEQYIVPGSGAAIGAVLKVASAFPGLNMVQIPGATPDLSGSVALLQPGVQNPLQAGMAPGFNMPFRAIKMLFPQHRQMLDEIDGWLNGPMGSGQSLLSEVAPTYVKSVADVMNNSDTNSQTASAVRASMMNLEAAGLVPDNLDSDPSAKEQYIARLRTQAKNQLWIRFFTGAFSPGPLGLPSEETAGSKADAFYAVQGARGLSDEYKRILNDVHGDFAQANLVWTELHPDKLFYETSSTQASTKNAKVGYTDAAQGWIEGNLPFMNRYKTVAAYFVPVATQIGDFSLAAFHAEMELGVRQHKTTEQYFDDIRTANAATEYFAATKSRDAAIDAHPELKSSITSQFADWKTQFDAINPLYAAGAADALTNVFKAKQNLGSLRSMLAETKLPSSVPRDDLSNMIDAYDTYHSVLDANPGSTNEALHAHAEVASQYNDYMLHLVDVNPQLAGLYQGVFRTLDSKVLDPLPLGG